MEDYKPNSHKSRETREKKVEPVIDSPPSLKKRSGVKKLADIFLSEDIESVKSYILMDVLVPAVKKGLYDIVTNGIGMILYSGDRPGKGPAASKVSYGNYYDQRGEHRNYRPSGSRNVFGYEEIVFENRGQAERVLDAMYEIIGCYGVVSILDLYDLANLDTDNYAAGRYGWTDIRGSKVLSTKYGYILKLPRAIPLN